MFVVAERYIILDVARKHILIGCEKAEKIMSANRKRCEKEVNVLKMCFCLQKGMFC